ncbi:succinate dehydrogenase assembly factor 3 mitochondrial [Crotalus adamanteus]|uniref:Succinate dehydrogenase assembly factor 3 n=1 Tax=Crotalus adamanteus TaxID=8729 RepID=A0AAW1B2Q3_CROAD
MPTQYFPKYRAPKEGETTNRSDQPRAERGSAFRCSRLIPPMSSVPRFVAWRPPSPSFYATFFSGAETRECSRQQAVNLAGQTFLGPITRILAFWSGEVIRTLYKKILQLHRLLPLELKALGDQYVKDEFRRHKSIRLQEAQHFLQEWENYKMMLQQQANQHMQNTTDQPDFGAHLSEEKLNALRHEQTFPFVGQSSDRYRQQQPAAARLKRGEFSRRLNLGGIRAGNIIPASEERHGNS